MRYALMLITLWAATGTAQPQEPKEFALEIIRGPAQNGLIKGDLGLNKQNVGQTFENAALKIPAGQYKGVLRYVSGSNFVAGPLGSIGTKGDFLLEVADVAAGSSTPRTNILFHGGNAPSQSKGCIMLGAVPKPGGVPVLPADHPLSKLRVAFYGTDTPVSSPNVRITIAIVESR